MSTILALDQGTTSSRAILFDEAGAIVAVAQHEFEQSYPRAGWVEHDPTEILTSQLACAVEVLGRAGAVPKDVAAIGITNQRETVIVWDRTTGKAIYPAIVWQDRRTASQCEALVESGVEETVSARTGLVLDPYFSADQGGMGSGQCAGSASAGRAGRAGLWDGGQLADLASDDRSAACDGCDECLADTALQYRQGRVGPGAAAHLQHSRELASGGCVVQRTSGRGDDNAGPGRGGDCRDCRGSAGGALWAVVLAGGRSEEHYGTGCFLLQNIGTGFVRSKHRLITTLAASAQKRLEFALEGSIFIGGAVVQWLRDNLKLIGSSAEARLGRLKYDAGIVRSLRPRILAVQHFIAK